MRCFSALQRAENSSIDGVAPRAVGEDQVSVLFSEPKIPQLSAFDIDVVVDVFRFSALQRAENSSIEVVTVRVYKQYVFQCSSASRKFLNRDWKRR